MTVLFSDDFNRANGAPGSNWVESGGGSNFQIAANELNCTGSNNKSLAVAVGALADQTDCKVTWRRASGSGYDGGVHLRSSFTGATSNAGSGYIVDAFNSQIDIIRRVTGVDTTVGSITGLTLADTDLYAVQISGTGATVSFDLFQNGSSIGSTITDTSGSRITSAGRVGIYVYAASSQNDDFQVEDIAAGGGGGRRTPVGIRRGGRVGGGSIRAI